MTVNFLNILFLVALLSNGYGQSCSPKTVVANVHFQNVAITNLDVDAQIASYNQATNQRESGRITAFRKAFSWRLVEIECEDGSRLRVAPQQKFYIPLFQQWKSA